MQLTLRQKHALEAICETFFPSGDGWPSAVEMGVPAALEDALEFNPRTRDRAQFLNLLDIWDSKMHGFLLAGKYEHFLEVKKDGGEGMVRSWGDRSLGERRAAFQGGRRAIGCLYVMLTEGEGAVPARERVRLPGAC